MNRIKALAPFRRISENTIDEDDGAPTVHEQHTKNFRRTII
jgi:hypothetical protein